MPTEDRSGAIPIGLYKSAKFFAVHADHLGTPRQITDDTNKLVWQWPYSAFGDNIPTGVLAYTGIGSLVFTQDPGTLSWLKLTSPGVVIDFARSSY